MRNGVIPLINIVYDNKWLLSISNGYIRQSLKESGARPSSHGPHEIEKSPLLFDL